MSMARRTASSLLLALGTLCLPAHAAAADTGNSTTCPGQFHWIDQAFGQCPANMVGAVGVFVGLSSIGFWLVAQAPQLYMNFKNGNADSLSPTFLLIWLLGDTTNLAGALLTHQNATQIYTAIYFCIVDFFMCSQWTYYRVRKMQRRRARRAMKIQHAGLGGSEARTLPVVLLFLCLSTAGLMFAAPTPVTDTLHLTSRTPHLSPIVTSSRAPGGRVLQSIFTDMTHAEFIGYMIGIVSATLYLTSRVPQIVKNFRRKATGGLSLAMFTMAVMGNLTYAASVFMEGTGSDYLLLRLPWLVGSVGTLCFDFTIFIQFWLYDSGGKDLEEDILTRTEGGYGDDKSNASSSSNDDDDNDYDDSGEPSPKKKKSKAVTSSPYQNERTPLLGQSAPLPVQSRPRTDSENSGAPAGSPMLTRASKTFVANSVPSRQYTTKRPQDPSPSKRD